ncbi:MAG: FecCD family ABC transporter permease, partial [Cytophagaceae bacterium]
PRVLLALAIGGSLALSGYLMQAMVNNPLADPYILGTASGASLGVNLSYMILPAFLAGSFFTVSLSAFTGALGITFLAVIISWKSGKIIPDRLLLTGIALSSMSVSLISLMIYLSDNDSKLKSVVYWSLGSLERSSWEYVPLAFVALIVATISFSFMYKHLNIMLLGESRAQSLGLEIKLFRWIILLSSSFLTGVAVAIAGPVGFVGLMIPHIVRGIFGIQGRYNIIVTVLIGGCYLLLCDIISRILYPPAGIPIGIITSFLGIPFFVYLLSKRNYRFS